MERFSHVELRHVKLVLEAALLTAVEPLPTSQLARLFGEELAPVLLRQLLQELQADWQGRSAELLETGAGWRFRARPEFQPYSDRLHPEKQPRYSRAVMETLAIIAYRQPVTRGDIEAIRGVSVSTQVIRQLEERAWVEVVGHKEVPGRPGIYATTRRFLDDFNLRTLADLPPLADLGVLQQQLAVASEQE